jgi:hypothetical protein
MSQKTKTSRLTDRVLAEHQPLNHWLTDDAANLFVICAQRFHAGVPDGRGDQALVHSVEINGYAPGARFPAKRHQDEAKW